MSLTCHINSPALYPRFTLSYGVTLEGQRGKFGKSQARDEIILLEIEISGIVKKSSYLSRVKSIDVGNN